jgi:CO dehydrogenase/acetyl-CoA synthase beta subunit
MNIAPKKTVSRLKNRLPMGEDTPVEIISATLTPDAKGDTKTFTMKIANKGKKLEETVEFVVGRYDFLDDTFERVYHCAGVGIDEDVSALVGKNLEVRVKAQGGDRTLKYL